MVWRPYSKNLSSAGLGHQQDTGKETEVVGGFCDLLVPAMDCPGIWKLEEGTLAWENGMGLVWGILSLRSLRNTQEETSHE